MKKSDYLLAICKLMENAKTVLGSEDYYDMIEEIKGDCEDELEKEIEEENS